jgi:excisionase family DNA binding protein
VTARARRPTGGGTEVRRMERHGGHDRHHRIHFFTITETAEMLRVCTRTVRRWIDRGELIAHRFGNAVRIAEPDLRAFLAVHRHGSWGQ